MAPGFWAAALGVALAAAAPATADEVPKYGGRLTYMIPADSPPSFDAQRGPSTARRDCSADHGSKVRFARDSPLEGDGFEPSVPRSRNYS